MYTNFTWDEQKAELNSTKHKVCFVEAVTIFLDPFAREYFDDDCGDEERWVTIGKSVRERLLVVVYTEPEENTARIISARLATNSERKDYEERV